MRNSAIWMLFLTALSAQELPNHFQVFLRSGPQGRVISFFRSGPPHPFRCTVTTGNAMGFGGMADGGSIHGSFRTLSPEQVARFQQEARHFPSSGVVTPDLRDWLQRLGQALPELADTLRLQLECPPAPHKSVVPNLPLVTTEFPG